MRTWATSHADTKGIQRVSVVETTHSYGRNIVVPRSQPIGCCFKRGILRSFPLAGSSDVSGELIAMIKRSLYLDNNYGIIDNSGI